MLKRHRLDLKAAEIASGQHGLITAAQALGAGLKRTAIWRRVHSGRWRRVRRGLYRITGAPDSRQQELMEACLAAGPGACASGVTAAELHGFDDVWPRKRPHVSVPHGRKRKPRSVRLRRATPMEDGDLHQVQGIPVTSPLRTIIDLVGVLPERSLELTIMDAIRRKLVRADELRERCRRIRGNGRAGFGKLRRILASSAFDQWHESHLEAEALQVMSRAGFPAPVSGHLVVEGDQRLCEVDFAYLKEKIAILIDGAKYHDVSSRKAMDEEQTAALERHGWLALRFRAKQVRERQPLIAALTDAFRRRGGHRVLAQLTHDAERGGWSGRFVGRGRPRRRRR